MSDILGKFEASKVRYSTSEHRVYLTGPYTKRVMFDYNILCRYTTGAWFFFNLDNLQCLIAVPRPNFDASYYYSCQLLKFTVDNDFPVFAVKLFEDQYNVIMNIGDQFKEQYASILLDKVINS